MPSAVPGGDETTSPPSDPTTGPSQAHLLELLTTCEQFFSTASPSVHNQLQQFLTAQGYHPITGLTAFLDQLAFTTARQTSHREPARPHTTKHTKGRLPTDHACQGRDP